MIIDTSDLGQEILGWSRDLDPIEESLVEFVRDNPAGQDHEQTPIILMHPTDGKAVWEKQARRYNRYE